jgi:hypothetical protein
MTAKIKLEIVSNIKETIRSYSLIKHSKSGRLHQDQQH